MTALQYCVAVNAGSALADGATQMPRETRKPRSTGDMTWAFASAPEGIRTPNLLIRSQMLYPLSYRRRNVGEFSLRPLRARNRLRWRLWG